METSASLAESTAAWALTYLVHSTLLLGGVYLVTRLRLVSSNELRETLWRVALLGGLATASLPSLAGFRPAGGNLELSRIGDLLAGQAQATSPTTDAQRAAGDDRRTWPRQGKMSVFDLGGLRLPPGEFSSIPFPLLDWPSDLSLPPTWIPRLRDLGEEQGGAALRRRPSVQRQRIEVWIDRDGLRERLTLSRSGVVASSSLPEQDPLVGWAELREGSWTSPLLRIWWAVSGVLLFKLLLSKLLLRRRLAGRREAPLSQSALILDELRKASGRRRPIRLTLSKTLASPVVLGSSEICIPERAERELSGEHKAALLAHELAHIVRRDDFWLLLAAVLERLFFFQPLNRLAARRLRDEAEYLCDDWAVRQTGQGRSLAQCLAEVAAWIQGERQPVWMPAMTGSQSVFVSRIRRLCETDQRPAGMRWPRRAAAGALMLAAVSALAPAIRAVSPPEPKTEPVRFSPPPVSISVQPAVIEIHRSRVYRL